MFFVNLESSIRQMVCCDVLPVLGRSVGRPIENT